MIVNDSSPPTPKAGQSGQPAIMVDDDDTTLTDALLDQFAAYYLLSVLAIQALEAAREIHAVENRKRA